MVTAFLLAPPCEEQEQVENNAVKVEGNPDPQQKDTLPEEYTMF